MCRLARAKAITKGPIEVGPVAGYAIQASELKKIYIRNGFQNPEIAHKHVDQWQIAQMAFRIRENIFFYLDAENFEEREAYDELIRQYTDDERDMKILGYMP